MRMFFIGLRLTGRGRERTCLPEAVRRFLDYLSFRDAPPEGAART